MCQGSAAERCPPPRRHPAMRSARKLFQIVRPEELAFLREAAEVINAARAGSASTRTA